MDELFREVTSALTITAEELDKVVQSLRDQGAQAYVRAGENFKEIDAQRKAVEDFQKRFEKVRKEWELVKRPRKKRKAPPPEDTARAGRGELLPEREYVFPILRALKNAGGSAPPRKVLAQVERDVGHQLTPLDRTRLKNGQIRWETRARWVRYHLVNAGLLSPNSPRGIWEITPAGESELAANDLQATWEKVTTSKRHGKR
ncbi:MAG: winged helix-turn-helix domain-containing protein [Candidatus Zipacnadales bacterium]